MESKDQTMYKIVNPEFTFEFNGKEYRIRKANMDKAIAYHQRIQNTKDLPGKDFKLVCYCIYLVLKDKEPDLTEQNIIDNTPADLDILECLTTLGFISPKNMEIGRKVEENLTKKLTTDNSSAPSLIEQDGHQVKSEN
jgi:hypothetical protein